MTARARTRVVHCKRSPHDVFIGRPGPWGNPFALHALGFFRVTGRTEAIRKYEAWVREQPEMVARIKRELRGKVLGCFCSPQPCHGDVLARIADEEAPKPAKKVKS